MASLSGLRWALRRHAGIRRHNRLDMSQDGDTRAPWALMPLVYDELRRLAAGYVRRERQGQTLQATALVNEAFVRLAAERPRDFENRTHFLAIAALSMRQILVQRARARAAAKRGGGSVAPIRVTLDDSNLARHDRRGHGTSPAAIDLLALDDALTRLAALDPAHARVVELRYFGGLSIEETAAVTGCSPATVKRQWALARAWLKRALDGADPDAAAGSRP
jgi:RNA polymerase sigma factor (TIGR02999 family)